MAHRLITAAWPLVALAFSPEAGAQLADPTRPPMAAETPAGAAGGSPSGGLQSVILRQNGKPAAIVHGQVVEPGDTVGDAIVVRIDAGGIVLRGPEGETTLQLLPATVKKSVTPAPRTTMPGPDRGIKESMR